MDETYVKVRGRWVYLYRAVDQAGGTVDFLLSQNRAGTAAQTFLRKAMKSRRLPTNSGWTPRPDRSAPCERGRRPANCRAE